MAVNLHVPAASALHPVGGVELGVAQAGVRKAGKTDLLVIRLKEGSIAAGVFTQNRFCAAPVRICRDNLGRSGAVSALLVNTGCANAGTGATGLAAARETCDALAMRIGRPASTILPFSTGVILEQLPVERVTGGLDQCLASLGPANWLDAARAIMTTDTLPKAASRQVEIGGRTVTITGISKGAGMIRPNMATMLGFVATDAAISETLLKEAVRHAADRSFNRISVDGDTSTNDSFVLIATGAAGNPVITSAGDPGFRILLDAVTDVAATLARAIVRDGEGATKFITVRVEEAGSAREAELVAYAIAHSPLVKTAFFASDPNLGRILCAIGYAGIDDLDVDHVDLYLDDVHVATGGGRHPAYREEDGVRVMKNAEITVRVKLARGTFGTTVWTCDFSYDYVKINADYRS